jgi:microfibrillar-associated protein 1
VDDTDDLDPSAEFDAWRLRELSRLARDKESRLLKESERAEIERRRALPEAQRLREDEEYARKTREIKMQEREERGFMDKFYHKGAFHQDDEILKRRVSGKTESAVDVNLLPKIMQVKNFGKVRSVFSSEFGLSIFRITARKLTRIYLAYIFRKIGITITGKPSAWVLPSLHRD